LLEKEIVHLQKSEYRWRMKHNGNIMQNQAVDKGSMLIEAVDKAIEIFMQMEDQYMDISGWQSEKLH